MEPEKTDPTPKIVSTPPPAELTEAQQRQELLHRLAQLWRRRRNRLSAADSP
jgi:hypothetical protein